MTDVLEEGESNTIEILDNMQTSGGLTTKESSEKEEVLSFLEDEMGPFDAALHDGTTPELLEDAEFASAFKQLEAEAASQLPQKAEAVEKKPKQTKQRITRKPKKAIVPQVTFEEEEEPEYEIESIVGHRLYRNSVVKYEIQWKGYSAEENTMEIAQTIHSDIPDLCAAYWDSLSEIPRPINAPSSRTIIVESESEAEAEAEAKPAVKMESKIEMLAPIFRTAAAKTVAKTVASSSKEMPVPKRVPKKATTVKPVTTKEAVVKPTTKKETVPKSAAKKETAVKTSKKKEKEPATKKEVMPVTPRKRAKGESEPSQSKKARIDMEHVPQYMVEKGFAWPNTWPNAKTKWNSDMQRFSAIQLSPVDKNIKLAYLEWKNGERTIHSLEECHQKCPEKLIEFYEERLRFV